MIQASVIVVSEGLNSFDKVKIIYTWSSTTFHKYNYDNTNSYTHG